MALLWPTWGGRCLCFTPYPLPLSQVADHGDSETRTRVSLCPGQAVFDSDPMTTTSVNLPRVA